MAKRQAKQIDYQSLESRDLVWLVQVDDDQQAYELLLERKDEVIRRLVRNCIRKYTFVDGDDMYQSLALNFPKIVKKYRPGKANTDWDKYCYHRLTYTIKDILRQRDDLGICWPQKKMYPQWFHLYDKRDTSDGCHADVVIDDRRLSEEAREQLEFHQSIEDLRVAFALSREELSRRTFGRPSIREDQPSSWSGETEQGQYSWLAVPATTQKRLRRPQQNLWQWLQARKKPKQVMLFK